MAFKFIALFAVLAVASAGPQYYQSGHESYQPTHVKNVEYADAPATYDFNYSVHDDKTGDIKQQQETAKEGVISGQYSLIDADGFRRIVDYTADDVHGFNAQVRREPLEGFKAPVVHKVVAAPQYHSAPAPIVQKVIAQPQYYSAPAPVKYVAPAPQYYSAPAPIVQKVIAQPQYYSAPAPIKYVAPAPQYYSAPAPIVQKVVAAPQYYSAPAPVKYVAAAPVVTKVVSKYTEAPITQVSFSGPSANYHY
ncbi:unnamed protein product [Diamesa hyperborea]